MKAGIYIGLGWAIVGTILLMILDEKLTPLPEIMERLFVWAVIGGVIGGAVELLIYLLDQLNRFWRKLRP